MNDDMRSSALPKIHKDAPGTLYEEVFANIKQYIVDNRLRAGDKLPTETELSASMGVGRSAVREALKSLQMLGILDSKQKEGMVVREFKFDPIVENLEYGLLQNEHKLIELMDLRIALELSFLETAIDHSTYAQLQRLRDIVARMESVAPLGHPMIDEDMAFHVELYANVDNELLRQLIAVFWKVFLKMKNHSGVNWDPAPDQTAAMHRRILEAFAVKDADVCRQLLIDHYSLKQRLLDSL